MSDITIQELFKGKSTIIKGKEFNPTQNYVEPFIDKMSKFTDDFRIQVKYPDQMTTNKDNPDVTFNRVVIQAVLPEKYCIDSHDEVVGFLYGLDVKRPIVKLYRGYLNKVCTNLCVFDPEWLNVQELVPGDPINYKLVTSLMEKTSDFPVKLKKLKNTFIDRDERKNYLGEWVDLSLREQEDHGFGKVKIASSTPINAYKSLFINQDSNYFIPEGISPSLFDVYNAFTQVVTDDKRDIMNKFEKTMLINRLLGI